VTRVEYYLGTSYLGASYLGPNWQYTWYPSTAGNFQITARAYDNNGAVTISAPINVRVRIPPTVSLISPASNIYATGSTLTLTATASQTSGTITRVDFFNGAVKIGEANAAPFTMQWTAAAPGRDTLTAMATNSDGLTTRSNLIVIGVGAAPTVSLTAPAHGAHFGFPGTVNMTATLNDPDGLASRVIFYANGATVSSITVPGTYSASWTPGTTGSHRLMVRVFDFLNLERGADTADIQLHNGPSVQLTSPAYFSAYTTGAPIDIAANVISPLAAIAEVRFYRDTVWIGTDASAPYGMTWANAPPGRHRIQARVTDLAGREGYSQALTVFVNDSGKAIQGGRLIVTGHDADNHRNFEFLATGLDFLFFGRAAAPAESTLIKGGRIAVLGTVNPALPVLRKYPAPVFINPSLPKWDSLAFDDGHFDAIIIGSGADYLRKLGSDSLNAKRTRFEEYFNRGGNLFAQTEEGLGQAYYNFLPAFGSARQQSIGSISGQFTVTTQGLAIGLTSAMVNSDLTHTEFFDIDSIFQVFETYNLDSMPITIGASAIIENGGFIPIDSVVAPPRVTARDTLFEDTLCVTFASATTGALLHVTTDGGNPDTSAWTMTNGSGVCIDRSTSFRVIAKKTGWVSSPDLTFSFRKLTQVITPLPDITDPYFADSLCIAFTSATAGSEIRYTLDGTLPDSASSGMANGSRICLHQSDTIAVIGVKAGMLASNVGTHAYLKMSQVAKPTLNVRDTVYFADTLCVTFSDSTPGAHILYTLDGSLPDNSELHAHDGNLRCFDQTTQVRMIATKSNWISSERVEYHLIFRPNVAPPIANRVDSTYFADTLCVRFSSATDSSFIRYSLDGGSPDTSSLQISNHQGFCIDRSADIKAQATRPGWNPSANTQIRFFKIDSVASVTANPGDSTYFTGSLCITLISPTPGSIITGSATSGQGGKRDFTKASGDTVCVDASVTLQAQASKTHWVASPVSSFRYFRRSKAEPPIIHPKDSVYFADSLCFTMTSPTSGTRIRYTLDGTVIDSASASLDNGGTVCIDSTTRLRAIAMGDQWLSSDTVHRLAVRMSTLSPPVSHPGDSTYFADSLCVVWNHPVDSATIHLNSNPQSPDTAARILASGDSVCIDRSAVFHAHAEKRNWIKSQIVTNHYFRKSVLDIPEFNIKDTVFFPAICVELRHANASAELHYTVVGGNSSVFTGMKYSGDTVCVNQTADIKVVAKLKNAIDSKPASIHLEKMKQVAEVKSSRADSLVFSGRLCFALQSKTDSTRIAYTLGGGDLSATWDSMANGDSLCITRSAEIRAVGLRTQWLNSDTARFVYVADNQGPDIVKAEKRAFQIANLSITGDCRGVGQDTLVIRLSEKIKARSRPPRWEKFVVFSPRCDRSSTYPVPILSTPVFSKDSLEVTLRFQNDMVSEIPQGGHCVYLDHQSGEFTDAVGNIPDTVGTKVEEATKTIRISNLRAYPPVVGLEDTPGSRGCSDEGAEVNTWIPPFGFDPVTGTVDSREIESCGSGRGEGDAGPTKIPSCFSVVEVVSNGGYVADIQIFDNFGHFVNSSRQSFGRCGELENRNRTEKGKSRSYLVWNSRDKNGNRVGTGAYLWRIEFKADASKPGQTRSVFLRTGFLRTEQCKN
jgi:Bacterial Ig domain/Chitobiase/beta-hexosaminidase C-terminal domain/Fn3 associated